MNSNVEHLAFYLEHFNVWTIHIDKCRGLVLSQRPSLPKQFAQVSFFFNFLIFLLVCLLPCTLCWFCFGFHLQCDCCKSCHLASHGVVLAVPPNHVISRSLRFTKHFKCYYLVLFLTPLVISIIVTTSSSLDHCSGRTGG